MGDVSKIIQQRRSIRSYKDIPVARDQIGTILHLASLAPNTGNLQAWKFIVIEDESKRQRMAHVCHEQLWMSQAPLHIAICVDVEHIERFYGKKAETYAIQDAASAASHIILAAENIGLASCWVASFSESELSHLLGLPGRVKPYIVLTIGYANEKVPTPQKQVPSRYTYLESWGGTVSDPNEIWQNQAALIKKDLTTGKKTTADVVNRIVKKFSKK